jgi:hypothetical protein
MSRGAWERTPPTSSLCRENVPRKYKGMQSKVLFINGAAAADDPWFMTLGTFTQQLRRYL